MTQDEQDAILGRTLREYKECSQRVAAIRTELRSIGNELQRLGQSLIQHPEDVIVEGQPTDKRFGRGSAYPGGPPSEQPFRPESLDGVKIASRIAELQQAIIEQKELTAHLASLGHKVQE